MKRALLRRALLARRALLVKRALLRRALLATRALLVKRALLVRSALPRRALLVKRTLLVRKAILRRVLLEKRTVLIRRTLHIVKAAPRRASLTRPKRIPNEEHEAFRSSSYNSNTQDHYQSGQQVDDCRSGHRILHDNEIPTTNLKEIEDTKNMAICASLRVGNKKLVYSPTMTDMRKPSTMKKDDLTKLISRSPMNPMTPRTQAIGGSGQRL